MNGGTMIQQPKVIFHIKINNEWKDIDTMLEHSNELVDYYLAHEKLSCCDMQGGFFIWAEGKPWNGHGSVEKFDNAVTWFETMEEIHT